MYSGMGGVWIESRLGLLDVLIDASYSSGNVVDIYIRVLYR
jgi:hypothetical protein